MLCGYRSVRGGGDPVIVLAAVAVFILGLIAGWVLGRRALVQELESLDREAIR